MFGAVLEHGDMTIAMGKVFLQNGKDGQVKVDKTFCHKCSADGSLVSVLHHSSLPYNPQ